LGFNPFFDFSTIPDTVWFTITTISTVGYGDRVPTTPVGRFVTIVAIIWGAYLMALFIAVQSQLLALSDTEKETMIEASEQKSALSAIVAALRF